MKTYARIQDGVVAELLDTDGDITQMFHPSLIWVEANNDTEQGDLYDGSSFSRPIAPEPSPQYKTQFSVLDFRDRFTLAEQIAIRQAQLTDMEVGLVYDAFISAQFIDIEDPRVGQGIDLYISKGLLEPNRKAALLEPELIPTPQAA